MPRGVKGPWGPSDLEAAIEAVVEGDPYSVVEERSGIPGPTIRNHLRRRGLERKAQARMGRPRVADVNVAVALEALASGASQRSAASLAGIAQSTIWRRAGDQGVVMPTERKRRDGSLTAAEREEIRVGIEAGESDAVIAERIGRHRSTVWREIKANGGRKYYRAAQAEARAAQAAPRPKAHWTEDRPWLWDRSRGSCAPRSGRPSRSPTGCAKSTLTSQSGGCPTRRSTRPSSSRPKASCARSSPPACVRAGPSSAPDPDVLGPWPDRGHGQHLRTPGRG